MTSFDNLGDYVAMLRLTGLRLSPDGSWLAATVQALSPDGKKFSSSIWRISTGPGGATPGGAAPGGAAPGGAAPGDADDRAALRLTRSAEGETSPEFLPDGALLFLSRRPGPATGPANGTPPASDGQEKPALWLLPPGGGEARRIVALSSGVTGLATASSAMRVALASPVLPGATGVGQDAEQRQARSDAGVTAILHEAAPVRYWDHDLGPGEPRLLLAEVGDDQAEPQDLTPEPGRALDEQHFELTPDG
ncbi:MAG: hypothetical protein QOJ73_550, partial [Streptosporangiaceae bacterium]|nr:hypothetical protein [Streptosporangiaceae bacterium]